MVVDHGSRTYVGMVVFNAWLRLKFFDFISSVLLGIYAHDKYLNVLVLLCGLLAKEWYKTCFEGSNVQSLCN